MSELGWGDTLIVAAQNPVSGPRHLGHYLGAMSDWPLLARSHALVIVIDDLLAAILAPGARAQLHGRTMQTVRECMALDIDFSKHAIVLTSMLPELHELATFAAMSIERAWVEQLHAESFAGRLTSQQRRELGLPRLPTLAEHSVPQLHLPALALALRADYLQGGEDMRGFMPILAHLAARAPDGPLSSPAYLPGRVPFVPGVDGRRMAGDNAIYLAGDLHLLEQQLERVSSLAVLRRIMTAVDPDTRIEFDDGANLDVARQHVWVALAEALRPFREAKIDAEQIGAVLERSVADVTERLRLAAAEIKAALQLAGHV